MAIPATPFQALQGNGKQITRRPVNEFDISTLVSIFPRAFQVEMHTVFPGSFKVESGRKEKPFLMHVGQSSYFLDIQPDSTVPIIEVPNGSYQVANSIVNDFCSAIELFEPMQMPGLFVLPGRINIAQLITDFKEDMSRAEEKQKLWFDALIKAADSMWVRSQGNPNAISDLARLAAEERGQGSKPWMQNTVAQSLINCTQCGSLRNPAYPICPNCKSVIDVPLKPISK
jgi:hypothetical protein